MAGIYIHIPFCRKKCSYCNFFSLATARYRGEFLGSLLKEIERQKDYLSQEEVSTIYFGGGTPSLLKANELLRILDHLDRYFPVSSGAEITLEANPDDLDAESIGALAQTPVNRLSIGIQSFFDEDLAYLDRIHDAAQAKRSVLMAKEAGFENLSIDLIYGIPSLTAEKWMANLDTFFSLDVPHLSAYSLTVEDKTPLKLLIAKNRKSPVKEYSSVEHFKILLEQVNKRGYIHYEISNFSLPGHYSKHNSLYWLGGHYLGLGPSAHSFNGLSRQWNASSLSQYLRQDDPSEVLHEKEVLTPAQRYNEYVMTSLRTIWGCDTAHIENVFGKKRAEFFEKLAKKFITTGHLKCDGSAYTLTEKGKLFADGISSELFEA